LAKWRKQSEKENMTMTRFALLASVCLASLGFVACENGVNEPEATMEVDALANSAVDTDIAALH
jgi:hypothetical protein